LVSGINNKKHNQITKTNTIYNKLKPKTKESVTVHKYIYTEKIFKTKEPD